MLSTVLQLVKSTVMRGRLMRMASIHANSSLIYLHLARKVASFIRSEDIDVVHAVLPNSYVVGAIATVLARRAKLVVSRVSLNWYQDGRPLLSLLERRVCHRMIDAAICNSGPIRQELIAEGIPPDKIQLIQNGIDAVAFSAAGCDRSEARKQIAVSDEALIFSSVANFYPYKGHADLLKALHLACEKLPSNWLLFTVGSDVDGYMNEMRGLSQTLGLARHVRFLGLRNDVETILHASDIHVSASHTEGLPNNVLEAMCANLPVVATAVGGVPDIVIHGRTGLLVPPGDSQGMACALLRLAHDRTLRRSMGEAGRNLVKSRFTLERSVSAFEAVYAAAAGSAPSAAL